MYWGNLVFLDSRLWNSHQKKADCMVLYSGWIGLKNSFSLMREKQLLQWVAMAYIQNLQLKKCKQYLTRCECSSRCSLFRDGKHFLVNKRVKNGRNLSLLQTVTHHRAVTCININNYTNVPRIPHTTSYPLDKLRVKNSIQSPWNVLNHPPRIFFPPKGTSFSIHPAPYPLLPAL